MHAGTEHATAARALAGALRTAGLEKARIGFDAPRVCGWLHTLGLEGIAGCDALNIFKQHRMVKSENENALLQIAGRMSEKAIHTTTDRLQLGPPPEDNSRIPPVPTAHTGAPTDR